MLTTYVQSPTVLAYRVLTHRFTRKLLKFGALALFIWFSVHMFNSTYALVNKDGVHGIVAKQTLQVINDNSEKAKAYDSIPPNYDF